MVTHPCCIPLGVVNSAHDVILQERRFEDEAIDRIETLPGYEEIFLKYLMKNKPFVLGKKATSQWRSRREWVKPDGKPDLKLLRRKFGEATVPVAHCGKEKFSSQPKTDMKFAEYIQYWENYIASGYPPDMENLYLKDWHFSRDFPDYSAYTTPVYFRSDWLNEFWDGRGDEKDDYRFVYMGPKGSWTPFHADVFRSYSWSANVCGQKKWIFFPPGEEEKLKDQFGNLAYDVTSPEISDCKKFPRINGTLRKFEVIQREGEIIFVPSGWHHQVLNVEDTISINHNWINGCNIDICWEFITSNLKDVQREISDCVDMDGWHDQCQVILKASSGINYAEFYRFLHIIAMNRIEAVKTTPLQKDGGDTEPSEGLSQRPIVEDDNDHDNHESERADELTRLNEGSVEILNPSDLTEKESSLIERQNMCSSVPGSVDNCPCTRDPCSYLPVTCTCDNNEHLSAKGKITTCSPNIIICDEGTVSDKTSGMQVECSDVSFKCTDISPAASQFNSGKMEGDCHHCGHGDKRPYLCGNHLMFDLRRLECVLKRMMCTDEFLMLNFDTLPSNPNSLLKSIEYSLHTC